MSTNMYTPSNKLSIISRGGHISSMATLRCRGCQRPKFSMGAIAGLLAFIIAAGKPGLHRRLFPSQPLRVTPRIETRFRHEYVPSSIAGMQAAHAQAYSSSTAACWDACIKSAQTLGNERVVKDSLACFLRNDGQQMGFTDCCNKVRLVCRVCCAWRNGSICIYADQPLCKAYDGFVL